MPPVSRPSHILYVDDDPAAPRIVEQLRTRLQTARLSLVSDAAQALERLARDPVDLLILDPANPRTGGLELLHAARARSQAPVLVVTARDSAVTEALAFANGAADYFEKPIAQGPFLRCIHDLLHNGGPPRTRLEVVSLGGLVRLIHADRKTCTLRITAGQATGALYFSFGNLVDAVHGALGGLLAAQEILGWHEVVAILDTQVRARPRTIHANVLDLLNPANHRQAPSPPAHPVLPPLPTLPPLPPADVATPTPSHTPRHITAAPEDYAESATYFDLVERARELLLVAEFDAAERLLMRALELLPGGRIAQQNLQVLTRRRGVSVSNNLVTISR